MAMNPAVSDPAPTKAPGAVIATEPLAIARPNAWGVSDVNAEGLLAGVVGAAVIALWFLILDVIAGRPLYTPSVLGAALLGGGEAFHGGAMSSALEIVMPFTWIHVLVFLLIGLAAAHLLALAEQEPSLGFGVVLLFVVFEFGFLFACMVVEEPVVHELAWPEGLIGNLLAASAMALVFRRRHPQLAIRP